MSPVEEYKRTDTGTDRVVATDSSSPWVGFMIFLAVLLAAGAIIFFMTYSTNVTQPPQQQQIIPAPIPGPPGPAGPPGPPGESSAPPAPSLDAPAVPGTNKGDQPGGASHSFPHDPSRKTLVV